MSAVSSLLTPGEVAARAGVSVPTLHHYEREGLIVASRTTGNQRRYHRNVLRRLALVRVAQSVGISLGQVREAFAALPDTTPQASDWAALATAWRAQLDERISALESLRDRLDGCIGCGCLSLQRCTLYNPDDVLAGFGSGAVRWDPRVPPESLPGPG